MLAISCHCLYWDCVSWLLLTRLHRFPFNSHGIISNINIHVAHEVLSHSKSLLRSLLPARDHDLPNTAHLPAQILDLAASSPASSLRAPACFNLTLTWHLLNVLLSSSWTGLAYPLPPVLPAGTGTRKIRRSTSHPPPPSASTYMVAPDWPSQAYLGLSFFSCTMETK